MSVIVKTKLLKLISKFNFISTSCSWRGCCVFYVTGHGTLMYNVHPYHIIIVAVVFSMLQGMVPYFTIVSESSYLTVEPYFRYLSNPTPDRETQPWFYMAEKCSKH